MLHTEPYFKLPQGTQDSLAKAFVPDVNWDQLSPHEQDNARNLTGSLFSVPKHAQSLTFHLKLAGDTGKGWDQRITFQDQTNAAGEVNAFLKLPGGLPDGKTQGGVVGSLDIWTDGIPSKSMNYYVTISIFMHG